MLTIKQKELFQYLNRYLAKNGISPSFEEMKDAVNLKSKSGIHRLITSLEQRGFIKRLKHRARAMEIVKSLNDTFIKEDQLMGKFNNNFTSIPLLGSIAAGDPIEAIQNPNEFINVPSDFISPNNQYFGLKVKGLSMIEKGIFDGDIAVIKKTNEVQNGNIAAVLTIKNEVTLKTIKVKNNKIYLISANKNYEDKVFDLKEVQIQGSLSGLIRKYN
jgi:repressor LexA